MESYFELPPSTRSCAEYEVSLPLDERAWNVGLITGPSGSGKTSIARALWEPVIDAWPDDVAIVDAFSAHLGIKDIIGALSSVGFSSPPSWLRPYRVLSTGEQFRAAVARALLEHPDPIVIDEFTSVVDRTVAKIGSSAVEKYVRRSGRQLIAVSCHSDIVDWLQPDWIYLTDHRRFAWRDPGERPELFLEIARTTPETWERFRHHHYLDTSLNRIARCFVGMIEEQPAAFFAALPFPHPTARNLWRGHRLVALPDYQGISLGNHMIETIASVFRAAGKRLIVTSSHPAVSRHRARSPLWTMYRKSGLTAPLGRTSSIAAMGRTLAHLRFTASFEFVGPARDMPREAALAWLGIGGSPKRGQTSPYLRSVRGKKIA